MGEADDELFAEAMRGVRRVRKPAARVRPQSSPPPVRPSSIQHVPAPAVLVPAHVPEALEQPWVLCASGVSRERLRRLAGASAEREIDLHGHTRDEGLRGLESALQAALAAGARTLCIVHGRGLHSQGRPVLKQAVFQWLREGPCAGFVLAAVPRNDSGGGASMVLLRRKTGR